MQPLHKINCMTIIACNDSYDTIFGRLEHSPGVSAWELTVLPIPLIMLKARGPTSPQNSPPPFSIFHENFQIYVAEHDDVGYIVLEQELLLGR